MDRVFWTVVAVAGWLAPASAQPLIATKAGVITHSEGNVSLDGKPVDRPTPGQPRMMQPNGLLHSGRGRAEVLLNPCVVLHLDENSSLRLLDNALTDTRLEIVSGTAIVHADGKIRNTKVTLLAGTTEVSLAHEGLYRFDADPPQLKVVAGKIVLERDGRRSVVTAGKAIDLASSVPAIDRFDPRPDFFGMWSERRVRTLNRSSGLADRENQQRLSNQAAARRAASAGSETQDPRSIYYDPAGPPPPPVLFPASPPGGAGRPRICSGK